MRPALLGIGITFLNSISYYFLRRSSGEESDDVLFWITFLLVSCLLSYKFRADLKTLITALILNPIFTLFIDSAFGEHFPPLHCDDTSLGFNMFRLTIKTAIEALPVLLGFATWRYHLKLKNRKNYRTE